jgi:lysophospholipase L1-like esterase
MGTNLIPSVDSDTKQLPDAVRARIAENLADAETPEGAAIVVAVAAGVGPAASVSPAELNASLLGGEVPPVSTAPPAVTVSNNQTLDGGPVAASMISDRKGNQSGWYTSLAPTDTTKQRYFAPSAPINNPNAPGPDTWNVSFPRGGVGPGNFAHEIRVTGGQIVQYMLKQLTGAAFRILVNGRYLTPTHQALGGAAGQMAFITVDFGAPIIAPVTITLEVTGAPFYGVIHQNASTISKVPGPDPKKLMMVLDSYGGGSGQVTTLTSLARTAAWLLGYRALSNTSIGGSGWLAGGNNGEPAIGSRVSTDIVNQAPDVVVFGLGHNDTAFTDAQVQAAAASAVAAVRNGLPNALIIVTGPLFSTPTPGRYASMQAAIFAGVSGVSGVVTVDTVKSPWITAANASKYVSSDGTHPVQVGANYFGIRYAAQIAEALAVKF